ncbi:N-acetylmuramoyl-L-alanine amidase [Oenococcus sicerae]|uniref:N-acetylmuramoyl-L-alanine amidase n=1 Tax=Oenococcus sicerae TaxID=2203724 RepID=UPI0039EA44E9
MKKISSFVINHIKKSRPRRLIAGILTLIVIGLAIFKIGSFFTESKITAQSINLCSSPSPKSSIVSRLNQGKRIKVISKNKNTSWWYVASGNQKGWVASWLIDQSSYNAKTDGRLAETTIVLDPGHGGIDSGTLAANGAMEKSYTLLTALKTYRLLKAEKVNVIMTRKSNKTVSLAHRVDLSNRVKANLYISFHFNSAGAQNAAEGYEVFKYHHNADKFAISLDKRFNNLPLYDRGVAYGNFEVLRDNTRPAILVEMGFMDNDDDFAYIQKASYQEEVARDILQNAKSYFN